MNANVADVSGMRRAIEQAYQRFGALHGVIHAAGVVGDNGYGKSTTAIVTTVIGTFKPRHMVCWRWKKSSTAENLDFCLLVSSLTSILGGIGHAAYARRTSTWTCLRAGTTGHIPVPWLSVNFDVWRLSYDAAAIDSGFATTLKELGMSAEEATR